ncbi:N-acyl homoserine lactonase family protein [Streptomyces sp. NPDC004726]
MSLMVPEHRVYSLRYATLPGRTRGENFVQTAEPAAPMPMDYFVWLVDGPAGRLLVDTGFSRAVGERRGRTMVAELPELLRRLDTTPESITDIVLTHLHYDHAGNLDLFPHATFHVQASELRFATGPLMSHEFFGAPFEAADLDRLNEAGEQGRVHLVEGEHTLRDGVELYRVGGHTGGTQVVRVHTARGWLVLASDALHYTENRTARSPFPLVVDVAEMFAGYDLCERLADTEDLIVPGHDPALASAGLPVAAEVRRLA